ncbi:uncharacterized protein LOC122497694 [Leptopilina heterotoma]|uniref:uncharacterized protein LOC122497694 n=1 Tax=Leptopilina heterotoma TaxID=63436 RepID=UPI001CA9ECE9|nr:uncharacterized protein LOC122497694 [Leptopilina heterotoma]
MNENECWHHDIQLVRDSHPKLYSRTRWYQEYRWDEPQQQYLCRGFWAMRNYVGPSELTEGFDSTKLLQGKWYGDGFNLVCSKRALPAVPPSVGFQSLNRIMRLTFLQSFYWSREGTPVGGSRWVLSYNIEPEEEWCNVGPEGLLREGEWTKGGRE